MPKPNVQKTEIILFPPNDLKMEHTPSLSLIKLLREQLAPDTNPIC